jgi:NAD(P)-dependent dehydrogenase (short-subunit alcohol dehydrogenase family)
MKVRLATVDNLLFGPWDVVTGASSGIGAEFGRQLAVHGVHVVAVARREALLGEVGRELSNRYGVEHRVVSLDLTEPDFLGRMAAATDDLDIGLVVSNAGTAMPEMFLSQDLDALRAPVRLHSVSCMELTYHFGARLAARGRGGMVLVGRSAASTGFRTWPTPPRRRPTSWRSGRCSRTPAPSSTPTAGRSSRQASPGHPQTPQELGLEWMRRQAETTSSSYGNVLVVVPILIAIGAIAALGLRIPPPSHDSARDTPAAPAEGATTRYSQAEAHSPTARAH